MSSLIVLWGVITWYNPTDFSSHLASGGAVSAIPSPWVAVDPSEIARGTIAFGDELWIYLPGTPPIQLQVLDTGPLYDYYIADQGPDVKIVADVHIDAWPLCQLSSLGYVVNHTRAEQELLKWVEE